MTAKQKNRKSPSGNHENCVTEERHRAKVSARTLVRENNEKNKGKKFERVPIFRGWKEVEIK